MKGVIKMRPLLPALILVLLASAAFCDTYTWEDQNGINFTDDLGKVPKRYRSKAMAEARKDSTETKAPVTTSVQSRKVQPATRQPNQETRLTDNNIPDRDNFQQEQPQHINNASDGVGYQDYYQPQERYGYNQPYYGGQSRGVRRAQRSAYESQTPARKAMNQAEEMIRQSRQALDSGGSYPPKHEYKQNGERPRHYNQNDRNR
jgi:hypothetical protein